MYLPRSLISKLYLHLQNTRHPLSPPVLILVALDPDSLCACRILTRLFKHDYIPHKIQPVAGYADLERVGRDLVSPMMETRGGSGGLVVCLGVGGMADMGTVLGLEPEGEENTFGGVEVWVVDAHRPWNLSNVFGGFPLEPETQEARTFAARTPVGIQGGRIERSYRPGKGGIIVMDDGDIEDDFAKERDAYLALVDMPEVEDDGEDLDGTDDESDDENEPEEPTVRAGQKRKSWSDVDDEDSDEDRPHQRRRSNSVSTHVVVILGFLADTAAVEPDTRLSATPCTAWPNIAPGRCSPLLRSHGPPERSPASETAVSKNTTTKTTQVAARQ